MFEFLHQRDDDAVEFTDIKRVASPLTQRIKFIKQQNAGSALREMEKVGACGESSGSCSM